MPGATATTPASAGPPPASRADEDAQLDARISKARSELTEIHKYIGRTLHSAGPSPRREAAAGAAAGAADDRDLLFRDRRSFRDGGSFRTPQPPRPTTERMVQAPHTVGDAGRTDRMRLAELSDVRSGGVGHHGVHYESSATLGIRPSARMSPVGRVRSNTSPRTSAKLLGAYSKDFVQQALDFDGVEDDEEDVHHEEALHIEHAMSSPSPRLRPMSAGSLDSRHRLELDGRSPVELRKYVKQMEETIAQLVQQKDELLRNQAEFDKHASGIFPSLEHLNHQLSQIVQGKMLQQSETVDGSPSIDKNEDVVDELRVQRELIIELEQDATRRKYDAELLEQNRAIEFTQLKGQLVSLVASSKLRDEKIELLMDSVEKVERELQESVKTLMQRFQLIDKRVNQLQSPMAHPRLVGRKASQTSLTVIGVFTVVVVLIAVAVAIVSIDLNCGFARPCRPLT